MKNLALVFSLSFLLINQSCESTDGDMGLQGTDLFELQYIDAGMSGEIIEKKDLEFNEFLELSSDNQFVKRRVYPDSTSIAQGNYLLIRSEDGDYYEFEYEEESYLIQNCTNSLKEQVFIVNQREIFNGSYLPCDGPGYGYQLMN